MEITATPLPLRVAYTNQPTTLRLKPGYGLVTAFFSQWCEHIARILALSAAGPGCRGVYKTQVVYY